MRDANSGSEFGWLRFDECIWMGVRGRETRGSSVEQQQVSTSDVPRGTIADEVITGMECLLVFPVLGIRVNVIIHSPVSGLEAGVFLLMLRVPLPRCSVTPKSMM